MTIAEEIRYLAVSTFSNTIEVLLKDIAAKVEELEGEVEHLTTCVDTDKVQIALASCQELLGAATIRAEAAEAPPAPPPAPVEVDERVDADQLAEAVKRVCEHVIRGTGLPAECTYLGPNVDKLEEQVLMLAREREELEREAIALRLRIENDATRLEAPPPAPVEQGRCRRAAQALIAVIGADGPESLEETIKRAVARLEAPPPPSPVPEDVLVAAKQVMRYDINDRRRFSSGETIARYILAQPGAQEVKRRECWSCGGDDPTTGRCGGCQHEVCLTCVTVFDHWGDGLHGQGDPVEAVRELHVQKQAQPGAQEKP